MVREKRREEKRREGFTSFSPYRRKRDRSRGKEG